MKGHAGSHDRQYKPREAVRPAPGTEWELWPEVERWERLRQLMAERARRFGRDGGQKKELFGKDGALKQLVDALVDKKNSEIDSGRVERQAELDRIIKSSPIRVRAVIKASHAKDAETDELKGRLVELDGEIHEVAR